MHKYDDACIYCIIEEWRKQVVNISKLIKEERIKKGLSVLELSKLSGISFKTIYLWESGDRNITFKSLEKLLLIFGKEIVILDQTVS